MIGEFWLLFYLLITARTGRRTGGPVEAEHLPALCLRFGGMDNHLLRTDVPNSVSQKSEQRHRVFTQPESEMDMSRRFDFPPCPGSDIPANGRFAPTGDIAGLA
jgi:hypothetical protein